MSRRKILSIVCIPLLALFIICLFIPFISDGSTSLSFWEIMDKDDQMQTNIIIIIELLLAVLLFILQICGALKDAKFAYFPIGYLLTNFVNVFISMIKREYFKYLSFGFWFGFIILIAILVLMIISNFSSNESKSKQEPIGYDPKTGKPIYARIKSYDPNTGKPIYE